MKLKQLQFPNWDGDYETIGAYDGLHIVLLSCIVYKGGNDNFSNLAAIDSESEVLWIAPIPEKVPYMGRYYCVSVDGETVKAWFESTIVYLELRTGKIISEHFVK